LLPPRYLERGVMSFIKSRLRRAEASVRKEQAGRCQECGMLPDGPGRIVYIDDGSPGEAFADDPEERCNVCGRRLWCVIRTVYDDTKGEGVEPY
jgi:hypothetical protein